MSFVGGGGVWAEFGRSALAVRTSNLPEPSCRCETWALPDAYVHAVRAWYDRAIRILRELQTFFDTRTVVTRCRQWQATHVYSCSAVANFFVLNARVTAGGGAAEVRWRAVSDAPYP